MSKNKRLFVKNALVLTVTAFILRAAGMVFRVWLSDTIGAEGMGLYSLVISVYLLASCFATSGLSTAVTRLVSDELVCGSASSVKRIVKKSFFLTALISVVMTAIFFFFAEPIAVYWIKDIRTADAIRILSFSLPFMGISSCIRGYFMARKKPSAPSAANIFEQTIRMICAVLLLSNLYDGDLKSACFCVLCADTVAEICSCTYVYIAYLLDRRKIKATSDSVHQSGMKQLVSVSAPIIAGRYLQTALHTAESMLVPQTLCMFKGTRSEAVSVFGMLKGMAMPVIFFPTSFLNSMSTLLIAEVSGAAAAGDKDKIRRNVNKAIHITLYSSFAATGVFFCCADEISSILYKSNEVGSMIRFLALLIPFMYLENVIDGILRGLNEQGSVFLYSAIDSVIRIVLILTVVPSFGLIGFFAIMAVSNTFTSTMNLRKLLMRADVKFDFVKYIFKPFICTAVAVFAAVNITGTTIFLCCVKLLVCIGVYLAMSAVTNAISFADLR
ncbi:MAG: polysaccharide biosynthesis protein [Acutalibacteraceae bacterium]|nr:polysaccharide biosynthesis protein [Acutalibacteraceae bacterium]